MPPAISVQDLRKSFGTRQVVSGISFEVAPGECFGLLGHNGAGKTTTIEILEGFGSRDSGEVSVLGEDPACPSKRWRERIGIVLQEVELVTALKVQETVRMFADLYARPRHPREVLELVGLQARARDRVASLSGGERRRLDVALGLIGNPELLFLDEPTTGFDPSARRDAWSMVADLRTSGVTVVLTTHYMEEAAHLTDRLAIMANGHLRAVGTAAELVAAQRRPTQISFHVPQSFDNQVIQLADGLEITVQGSLISMATQRPQRDLRTLTQWAENRGLVLEGLEVRPASLEDVFLELGGPSAGAP